MGAAKQMKFAIEKTRITNHKAEWLLNYSKFENVEDFNNHYEQIMIEKKKKFTKVQHAILTVIRRYACKVPGVANASYKEYNKILHKELGHTVARDTFTRTLDKAERSGIIIKLSGKRLNGSYTANVIVFNRAEEVRAYEIAAAAKEEAEIKAQIEKEFAQLTPALQFAHNAKVWAQEKAQKEAEKEAEKRAESNRNGESNTPALTDYQKLKEQLKNVVTEKEAQRAFGAWKVQTNRMINKPPFTLATEAATVLRNEVKRRHNKNMKPLNNPIGYYNRVLSNMLDQYYENRVTNAMIEVGLL